MKNILEVKNISKSFKEYKSEFKRVLSWFGAKAAIKEEHHILNDISFSIKEGEAIGIIGQNGAGKSTLLKIITGTLKPSSGSVHINGRISAILELGMGFNPQLTGRQNVYNTLGMMGYLKTEIDKVIKDIENFADIGDYFDQHIRVYSSGMQARVAFAVATAFRPDILIVDEALSVGDIFFGIKCIDKMDSFKRCGTSILLVTHDMGTLRRFCDRGIVLENGKKVFDGDVLKAISLYSLQGKTVTTHTTDNLKESIEKEDRKVIENIKFKLTHFSPNIANVEKLHLYNSDKMHLNVFEQNSTMYFECAYELLHSLSVPYFHISIVNAQNLVIYAKNSFQQGMQHKNFVKEKSIVQFSGKFKLALAPGKYIFIFALHSISEKILKLDNFEMEDFISQHRKVILTANVEVEIIRSKNGLEFFGLVDLPSVWE
jgi:lipopolysaccharide transport system ATP-binding protein